MLESLVITLREGMEAALVVGIILTYLSKTGKSTLRRKVYLGLSAAVVASIAFGVLFQALNIDPENEYLEGAMLGIAGIMVATLVIWMWRVSRSIKATVEKKLGDIITRDNVSAQGLGLLVFTFLMVFREGIETVLFLMSATLGKFDFLSLLGGILGIGLSVLFAVFFIRGSLRINLSRFFGVTSMVLLVLALKLILGSLHEFAEVGAIPMSPELMAIIGFFVRDNTSTLLLVALLIVPLLVILWDTRVPQTVSPAKEASAVERRKRLAAKQQERTWRLSLLAVSFFIIVAMVWAVLTSSAYADPVPSPVAPANGEVRIKIAELTDGKLVKYSYNVDGTEVRFLVVRHADGSISTALDACQICGPVGYGQGAEEAICKKCNAPIALETIGRGGGCNPLPLAASLADGAVVIRVDELAKAKIKFQ